MSRPETVTDITKTLSAIELAGICLILLAAFGFQFLMGELPCPLCLLQRLGLLAVAFGFMLNMRYRPAPAHYGLSILAAVATSFTSMRQISLHITSTEGYGSAVFGLHMYTWVFIICTVVVIYSAAVLSCGHQYVRGFSDSVDRAASPRVGALVKGVFALYLLLIVGNIGSLFVECGVMQCPDNPVDYKELSGLLERMGAGAPG